MSAWRKLLYPVEDIFENREIDYCSKGHKNQWLSAPLDKWVRALLHFTGNDCSSS